MILNGQVRPQQSDIGQRDFPVREHLENHGEPSNHTSTFHPQIRFLLGEAEHLGAVRVQRRTPGVCPHLARIDFGERGDEDRDRATSGVRKPHCFFE